MPGTRYFVSSPSSFINTLHTSLVCIKNVKWQNWQQNVQKNNFKIYYCLEPHVYLTRGVFENIKVRTQRRTRIFNLIFCFLLFNHWETLHVFSEIRDREKSFRSIIKLIMIMNCNRRHPRI